MKKPALTARWYARWNPPVATQPDPADVGTAFGLDLSLQHPAAETPPSDGQRPAGWRQRWAARRRPAA